MAPLRRLARFVKADMYRPDDRRVWVRKLPPGLGWTINLAALRRHRQSGR